jgi:hypothetical protein
LDKAMDALRVACAGFDAPSHVCAQCYKDDIATRFVAAAREVARGGAPAPEEFGQMYFEHPECSGGIDVVKLMFPRGVETMLVGTQPPGFAGYPEVLENAFQSGIWFWPAPIRLALRAVAGRLFWDWFGQGHYGLDGWPVAGREDDTVGPGDDILKLCAAALIDPAHVVACLEKLETIWADDALTLCLLGASAAAPSYCAAETHEQDKQYLPAMEALFACLRAREAGAALEVVTPDWLQAAFFRYEISHPVLAAEVSKLENFYPIHTVEAVKAAQGPTMMEWLDLPQI